MSRISESERAPWGGPVAPASEPAEAREPDRDQGSPMRWETVVDAANPELPAWEAVPAPSLRERLKRGVSAPIAAGIAVFGAVLIVAIVMVLVRPSGGEAVDEAAAEAEASSPAAPSQSEDAEPAAKTPADDGKTVMVHVVGEVKSPGIVELDSGSRVADAIEAAGGAKAAAVIDALNLARVVADGEQIVVPDAEGAKTPASGPGDPVGGADQPAGAPVNLNQADAAALETLPRIGPALAQRIIEWRDANGGFTSVDQLGDVTGIGEKTLAGMRDLVTI